MFWWLLILYVDFFIVFFCVITIAFSLLATIKLTWNIVRPPVCSVDRGSHRLCFLFQCHYTQGCWMGYAASHVLCLGSLVEHAGGCIQRWMGLWIRFPAQVQWEKQLKLFVVLTQANSYSTSQIEQGHWLCTENYWFCSPISWLECPWATRFPGLVASPSGLMWPECTLHSGWGYISVPLPGLEDKGPLHTTLSFPNRLSGWEESWAILSLGYELITLPVHTRECSTPGARFTLDTISSACPPLSWSYYSAPCQLMARARASKTPCLRCWIRLVPCESPLSECALTWFCK